MSCYEAQMRKAIWRKTAFVCLRHEGSPVMGRQEESFG